MKSESDAKFEAGPLSKVADNCGEKKQTASIRSQSLNPRLSAKKMERQSTLFTMSLNKQDEMETELTCDIEAINTFQMLFG